MGKQRVRLSDQVRQAVSESGMSRYAICKAIGMDQATMTRFIGGTGGLSTEKLDVLAEVLNLRIVADKPKAKGR